MLIGLAGPAHVGKTTIAKDLEAGYSFKILSYAAPLKEALVTLTGFPMHVFTDEHEKYIPRDLFGGQTSRDAMQKFGTEFCRNMLSEDFWLKLMLLKLESETGHVVIDDVRFQDEADLIMNQGGVVIDLYREGVEFSKDHQSEMGVHAPYHILLPNGAMKSKLHVRRELGGYGLI